MFELTHKDHISTIKMTHGKVNAMSLEFCSQLNQHLRELAENQTRAVVLTGNGRVFSAGVDLKRVVAEGTEYLDRFLPELINLFENIFQFPKPLVAAINGHAVAGGCVMACGCDFRLISTRARIGVPELRVGVPFPTAGMEIMRWSATPQCFRKMINIGATFTGQQAVAAGLADDAVEPESMMDAVNSAARELTTIPIEVFQLTKRQMRSPVVAKIARGNEKFADEINRLWRCQETRAAVQSYVASRLG